MSPSIQSGMEPHQNCRALVSLARRENVCGLVQKRLEGREKESDITPPIKKKSDLHVFESVFYCSFFLYIMTCCFFLLFLMKVDKTRIRFESMFQAVWNVVKK